VASWLRTTCEESTDEGHAVLTLAATVAGSKAFHIGLVLTAFGFGFRHGIDWDHVAALTDITSSQTDRRRSMWFATLYALGHALVVFALGFGAIVLAQRLPNGVDTVMERFVGATLIILAAYVFYALGRDRRDFRMRSRWMLLFASVHKTFQWARTRGRPSQLIEIVHDHPHATTEAHDPEHDHAHEHEHDRVRVGGAATTGRHQSHRHPHRHQLAMPDDPFADYAPRTAFGVGMIHGVGAETPTQVLIFLTAAGAGGKAAGLLLLVCFLVGLLASNSLVALAGAVGFLGATRNFRLYVAVSLVTAVFSLVIGTVFLFGSSSVLPAMLGG
jgi:high-affinity nickel-transport protein